MKPSERYKVEQIKQQYPAGTRLELKEMDDPYAPVQPGTRGTVAAVDDLGSICMKWDNGRTLSLIPDVDQFRKLSAQEIQAEQASYEFADSAYVSGLKVLGGQSYLNQMVIQKIDSLVDNLLGAYGGDSDISACRVNCYVEYDPDGELYWIYVFYG